MDFDWKKVAITVVVLAAIVAGYFYFVPSSDDTTVDEAVSVEEVLDVEAPIAE